MGTRTIPTATAFAVLLGSAALAAGPTGTGPAVADSTRVLRVSSVGDIVVDDVREQLFVSDPRRGRLVVTDFTGRVTRTFTDLPGVRGLELSAGGEVYAAVGDDDLIMTLDAATLTETGRHDLDAEAPHDLALAGGKLWFSHASGLGSLDFTADGTDRNATGSTDGNTTGSTAPDTDGAPYTDPVERLVEVPEPQPHLGADPAAPGVLVTAADGVATVYDVSTGEAVQRVRRGIGADDVRQIDVTPDGRRVVVASATPHEHVAYSTADLSRAATYRTHPYPVAVAVAPDGTVAAGTVSRYDPDVHVFPQGRLRLVRSYDFPNTGDTSASDVLLPGALAWTRDSRRLFALTANSRGTVALRVFDAPSRALPKVSLFLPSSAERARRLTVTGRLSATVPLPVGTPLRVTRTDLESPRGRTLPVVRTTTGGAFSFRDTPYSGGKVTYRVTFGGGPSHAPATGAESVRVSRAAPALRLDADGTVHPYGTPVRFTATLGGTHGGRTVSLYADRAGDGRGRTLVRTGRVTDDGRISTTLRLTRDTRVTAVYGGDSRTAPGSVTSWAGSRVRISTTLEGHYRTARTGGVTTHHFRPSRQPVVDTTMTARPGRRHQVRVEVRQDGRWKERTTRYIEATADGRTSFRLPVPRAEGVRARVRVSYVNARSGDRVHSTTRGAWKYLTFTG
ncbi:Ig-like domain repeat protein [Streptomyces sp. JNUCC 64]